MEKENLFKWKHYQPELILLTVRWYLRYNLSFRDLVEMMEERGLSISHTTIMRWVHQYGPELDKRIRRYLKQTNDSWRVDETYIKVKGQWMYLYRDVDSKENTIDFCLSKTRDQKAAKRFFKKALRSFHVSKPRVITVDKNPAYPIGVCLGAQLIGEALGASYEHSPEKEVGTFPITLTEEGKTNELFSHFAATSTVGHWHNDMPGLTKNSKILAFSEGCPRQIVEYSELVYGFQYHMEFTPELIELLIQHSEQELEKYKENRFVQSPEQLRKNDYTTMNNQLYTFLDKLTSLYQQK